MTICTRSSVRNINSTLPRGWKKITAHSPNSDASAHFYISPEGKRFQSLMAAKAWLIATIEEFEKSEIIESPKRRCRRIHEQQAENEKRYEMNNFRLVMSENIKRRRKAMSERNPYRNLLKTVLSRNHRIMLRKASTKRKVKPMLGRLNPRKHLTNVKSQNKPILTSVNSKRKPLSIISRLQRREG